MYEPVRIEPATVMAVFGATELDIRHGVADFSAKREGELVAFAPLLREHQLRAGRHVVAGLRRSEFGANAGDRESKQKVDSKKH